MLAGVEYEHIDDAGLHIKVDGKPQLLEVDTIVICAGQEPRRELVAGLVAAGITPALDRRRGCRARARRQARNRSGNESRAGLVGDDAQGARESSGDEIESVELRQHRLPVDQCISDDRERQDDP